MVESFRADRPLCSTECLAVPLSDGCSCCRKESDVQNVWRWRTRLTSGQNTCPPKMRSVLGLILVPSGFLWGHVLVAPLMTLGLVLDACVEQELRVQRGIRGTSECVGCSLY